MAVRRLYEPLCIAFGTTISSPAVPTYQLHDLPHKFTPRLYITTRPNAWGCFKVGARGLPEPLLDIRAGSRGLHH